jgi:transposase
MKDRKYTPEFKIEVIETKIREKLSSYEATRRFNLMIKSNEREYPDHHRVLEWKRIYLEEGKEGLYKERTESC